MSLLASFMSAITILGTPAEMFVYGTQYWIICISILPNGQGLHRWFPFSRYQLHLHHLLHRHTFHADVCQNGCHQRLWSNERSWPEKYRTDWFVVFGDAIRSKSSFGCFIGILYPNDHLHGIGALCTGSCSEPSDRSECVDQCYFHWCDLYDVYNGGQLIWGMWRLIFRGTHLIGRVVWKQSCGPMSFKRSSCLSVSWRQSFKVTSCRKNGGIWAKIRGTWINSRHYRCWWQQSRMATCIGGWSSRILQVGSLID